MQGILSWTALAIFAATSACTEATPAPETTVAPNSC